MPASAGLNSPRRRAEALKEAPKNHANISGSTALAKPTATGAPAPSAAAPSSGSLRLELQQEQLLSLTREADGLRAQLDQTRQQQAKAESAREEERSELVASYERMLSEQAAAVRQYEARAACVGTLRLEARKRDAELAAVRQESVSVRQRLTVVSKVWRQSVLELESCLDREIQQRHHFEAERVKFGEIHRKRLQSLQREADARSAEAKKVAEREETAVQQAMATATKQAERSMELKVKEAKAKADETVRKERSSHQVQLSNALSNAERERERLVEESIANLNSCRRQADEERRERALVHEQQLEAAERARAAEVRALHVDVDALETALEAASRDRAKAQAAAKAATGRPPALRGAHQPLSPPAS